MDEPLRFPWKIESLCFKLVENRGPFREVMWRVDIDKLCERLARENLGADLRYLVAQLKPVLSTISRFKAGEILNLILMIVSGMSIPFQIILYRDVVEWGRETRHTIFRQRVEAWLAHLLMKNKQHEEALALWRTLAVEAKSVDNKLCLVDLYLLESRFHISERNLPKARAALAAARTAAYAINVSQSLQGEIDFQCGILHTEEKAYETEYSYFAEAFESSKHLKYNTLSSLTYMLLCKIMASQADDVAGIISSKVGLGYVDPDIDAMKAVAHAVSKRSMKLFQKARRDYKAQLEDDPIVDRHVSSLYDTLLEQNLFRLIEPFSRVEIARIAELIELPLDHVEERLAQMVLDKKFAGTLDRGAGCLIIFEYPKPDAIYSATLDTIAIMGKVVDSLYVRSAPLHGLSG